MFTNNNPIVIKRISNDIREITRYPLEGIGIISLDNDPMRYVVNMKLMTGPYEGYFVQLLLTIPNEYPIKPPKILIYPNQGLNHNYHHHIFNGFDNYGTFCIDLLDNQFMSTNDEHTGWNPSYSISSILLQIQNFLSDPDMTHIPSNDKIKKLMDSMNNYKRAFTVKDNQGERTIIHTWKEPYPPMYFKTTIMGNDETDNDKMMIDEEKFDEKIKIQLIKENLTCYVLKENYIDNPNIILGYPIVRSKALYGNDKIELYPIPQMLTYEGYLAQTKNNINCLFGNFILGNQNSMKAANNEYFNNWLPIYVDKNHFEKNKQTILESIRVIKNESTFSPSQIFDILPLILNKMIVGMFNGKSIISSAFITSYFHYVLLFKKLCVEFEDEFTLYFNQKIELIRMNNYNLNKRIAPDIGNFFMLMFFSNKDMNTEEMKKIRYALFEEFFTRQLYWIFHGEECKEHMKNLLLESPLNMNDINFLDEIFIDKFEEDPNFKMRYLDIFNNELYKLGIFWKIVNIISNDSNFLYFNGYNNYEVKKRMTQSFKKLYNECSREGKDKLRELIIDNMHFSHFFENDLNLNSMKESLYNSFKVDKLLKKIKNIEGILKYAYESQRGNQLLLITFFTLKKMEEPGFMDELEKNYGIFLDVDKFVEELKIKLKEVNSFKALYQYIGTEFGQDKSELELIVYGYERAKKKKYIRDPNEPKKNDNIILYEKPYIEPYRTHYGLRVDPYRDSYGNSYYGNSYQNHYQGGRYGKYYRKGRGVYH